LAIVAVGMMSGGARAQRRLKSRMNRVNERYTGKPRRTQQTLSVKRNDSASSIASLDKILQRTIPNPALLRARLQATGFQINIGQYVLTNLVVMAVIAAGLKFSLGLSWGSCAAAGFGLGLALPHFVVGFLGKRRSNKFINTFPEAIDLIVRGLKSGLPTQEGIKVVANEMGDPIGTEFREIADSLKLGKTLDDALWDAAKRLDIAEFKFFVISLSVQRETGGNLAETLENLGNILRARRQMKIKVKAMSSEAKASAIIIGSLPFIMFLIIFLMNPGYASQLFTDSRGVIMVIAGLTSIGTGIGVMAKLIKFEI
ncbi:MAG: type II secretion system F family protein, partial [Candidatus Eiseniibacteriota bacterium]